MKYKNIKNRFLVLLLVSSGTVIMIVAILITLQIFTISEDISVNYAGMYADEIVNSVNENLSVDLAVIEAFSKRHEIIDWFLDEEDSEKKEIAFQEFELMRQQLLNQNYFVAVDQTKNFYYVDNTTEDINTEGDKTYAPTGILSETEILDNWYFETKNMKQQYDLNIDLDRYLNILRVWINYKVVAGDEVIGVFGTGIEITGFIKEVLTQHAQNGTKTFVIDSSGMIQLDADSINIRENSFQENVNLDQGITNIVSSNEFDRIMKDYLLNPNQETIFSIEGSTYDYIAVSPIKDTGWHVITLFDSKSLFQKSDFLPIVLIVIILFLAYTVIISQIINRLFIVPFYQLNRSIMEKGNQLGGRIFGLNRKDEFGDLANTIQEMKVQLDDSRIRLQKESDYKSGEILRIFDTIPVGVFVLDENFHIVYLNKYLIELFHVRDNQVCRIDGTQDCSFAFANKKDYDEFIKRINTDRLVQVEYRLFSGTQEFWAEIKVTQLTNDKGTLRFEGLLTNIQERKHFEENLITRSITDSLTGIYNRSRFDEVIHEEIERNNRYGENVSLMIFDLDFFKRVNDTFGHDVGDQVLIEVAETVKKEIRVTDIFARWGGEEFAILMPHTDSESGMHVAEKVRLSIAAIVHEEVGRVTASFGVSEYITGESYVDWFKRVDIALFEAKGKGRNRVELNSIRRAEDSLGVVRLKWSIAYESGHNEIDEEHKQLLNLANDLFHSSLVLNQREKETEALERIIKHVNQHFRHEIQILKEHQYENYEEHSKIHTALFEHLSMLKKMYDNDEIKATAFFSVIVDEIIIGHLIKEDTKFFSLFNISAENSPTS